MEKVIRRSVWFILLLILICILGGCGNQAVYCKYCHNEIKKHETVTAVHVLKEGKEERYVYHPECYKNAKTSHELDNFIK